MAAARISRSASAAPGVQATGPDQTGRGQGLVGDQNPRAEADAVGDAVGLRHESGAKNEGPSRDRDAVADLQVEAGQQGRVRHRARGTVALRQETGEGLGRVGHELAGGGVVGAHGLQFDESRTGLGGHGHGPQGRHHGYAPLRVEGGTLLGRRLPVDQAVGEVAAQDARALPAEALGERARDRGDAGDGRDAEGDAGEEDGEARQPAAQFAEGEAQGERDAQTG
jgi:hypothetical protein